LEVRLKEGCCIYIQNSSMKRTNLLTWWTYRWHFQYAIYVVCVDICIYTTLSDI